MAVIGIKRNVENELWNLFKEPLWLKEMFEMGRLSKKFNPNLEWIKIKGKEEKKNVKIGVCFDGPLLPTTEGASNRIYNLAKYLSNYELDIYVFKCYRECDDIRTFKKCAQETGINFYLIHPKLYYSNFLVKLISKTKPDILHVKDFELILPLYKRLNHIKFVYDAHDVKYKLLEQLKFSKNIIEKTKKLELETHKVVSIHLCVSEIDKQQYLNIGCNPSKIMIIPNGVDLNEINNFGPNTSSNTILFLGNMLYYPNLHALKLICKKMVRKLPEYKFLFVGFCPKSIKNDIVNKYKKYRIIFTGPVENLNVYFKRSTIAIAPIYYGSGTRIKILYYLGAGIPTICTKKAAEGLNVKNNIHLILEDKIENYPKIISSVTHEKGFLSKLSKMGFRLVNKNYRWENIAQKLSKIYLNLIA